MCAQEKDKAFTLVFLWHDYMQKMRQQRRKWVDRAGMWNNKENEGKVADSISNWIYFE